MLKKAERKEQLISLYRKLRIETASKDQMKEIRTAFALYIGRDVGVYIVEKDDAEGAA